MSNDKEKEVDDITRFEQGAGPSLMKDIDLHLELSFAEDLPILRATTSESPVDGQLQHIDITRAELRALFGLQRMQR